MKLVSTMSKMQVLLPIIKKVVNLIITFGESVSPFVKTVELPEGYHETTSDYFELYKQASQTQGNQKSTLIKLFPSHQIFRQQPIANGENIHWKFECEYSHHSPNTFIAKIPNCRVWGDSGTVITPENKLLADVSIEFAKTSDRHSVFSQLRLPAINHVDGEVAVLSVAGGKFYYHWMLEVIPRIYLLQEGGIELSHIDKFIVNSYSSAFQKETLFLLGIPANKIIVGSQRFHIQTNQLIVPSLVGDTGNPPKWACKFIRESFLKNLVLKKQERWKRIYITRRNAKQRKIINETEIVKFLTQLKFEVLELESMSVIEQAAAFYNAEVIVSPHGAGLTNLVFCNPGTQVIELFSPNYVNVCYWALSNQMELEYHYLIGDGKRVDEYKNQHEVGDNIIANLDSLSCLIQLTKIAK